MSDLKTLNDLAKESGITFARVNVMLKDVRPEQTIGRTKGYHPDALKTALINKYQEELRYLGLLDAALDNLQGYGA